LVYGRRAERSSGRLIGRGEGIHWLDLDEDISVAVFSLAGLPARRTARSADGSNPGKALADIGDQRPGCHHREHLGRWIALL